MSSKRYHLSYCSSAELYRTTKQLWSNQAWGAEDDTTSKQEFIDEDCRNYTKGRPCRNTNFCPYSHNMAARQEYLHAKKHLRADELASSQQKLQQSSSNDQPNTSKAAVHNVINSRKENFKANHCIGSAKNVCSYAAIGAPCRRFKCTDTHATVNARNENLLSALGIGPTERSEAVPSISTTKSAGKIFAKQVVQQKAPPPNATETVKRNPPNGVKKYVKKTTNTQNDGACVPKAFAESCGHKSNSRRKGGKKSAKCRDFFGNGSCPRGENCAWSHNPDVNHTSNGHSADIVSVVNVVCENTTSKAPVGRSRQVAPSGVKASGTKPNATIASVKHAPVKDAPVKDVLVGDGYVKNAPVKDALVKDAPVKDVPEIPLTTATPNDVKRGPKNRKWKTFSAPTSTIISATGPTYSEVAKLSPAEEKAACAKATQDLQHHCNPSAYEDPSDLAILNSSRPASANIDPAVKTTKFGFRSWDSQNLLYWMDRNLSRELKIKLKRKYRPFLENGVIPMSVIKLEKRKGKDPRYFPFPYLPYEIREMVWKNALRDTMQEATVMIDEEHLPNGICSVSIRPTSKLPRLMRVSKETYCVAAKFYEKAFATTTGGLAKTWFNFEKDCLFVLGGSYHRLSESLEIRDIKRLRYLKLPLKCWISRTESEKQLLLTALLPFKSLMKIWILAGDGKDDEQYTKDVRIIAEIKWLVKKKFYKCYKDKDCFPDVEQTLVPALHAKFLKIDNLMY
jgi:hypothetical protein